MSNIIILLNHALAQYGPETKEAHGLLSRTVLAAIDRIWLKKSSQSSKEPAEAWSEVYYEMTKVPAPQKDASA